MTPLQNILAMSDEAHAEFINGTSDDDLNTLVDALSDASNDPDIDQERRRAVTHVALIEQGRRLMARE